MLSSLMDLWSVACLVPWRAYLFRKVWLLRLQLLPNHLPRRMRLSRQACRYSQRSLRPWFLVGGNYGRYNDRTACRKIPDSLHRFLIGSLPAHSLSVITIFAKMHWRCTQDKGYPDVCLLSFALISPATAASTPPRLQRHPKNPSPCLSLHDSP